MDTEKIEHPKHACQYCGSEIKLVEIIIDDEFIWDECDKKYIPNQFTDVFEHTGVERCGICDNDWSGSRENVDLDS